MHVVPDEDITMFARGLLGREGPRAHSYAQDRSRQLATLKDEEGARVWARVAAAIAVRTGKLETAA